MTRNNGQGVRLRKDDSPISTDAFNIGRDEFLAGMSYDYSKFFCDEEQAMYFEGFYHEGQDLHEVLPYYVRLGRPHDGSS